MVTDTSDLDTVTRSVTDVVANAVADWVLQHGRPARYVVALSGGLDSQTLLHALHALQQVQQVQQASLPAHCAAPILALHIDHQLQPQNWAQQLAQQCAALGVACHSVRVDVDLAAGQGLEAAARAARYQAFADFLQADDLLLLAQHQNDQAETLLLRLLRGAGSDGLAAMPASRAVGAAHLLRPLLGLSRTQLERYARRHSLPVLQDPSNQSDRFDRNFLRLNIMPLLRKRWPALDTVLADVAGLQRDAAELHADLAAIDAIACDQRSEPFGRSICEQRFKALSLARRRNCLRGLCVGAGLATPPRAQLQVLLEQLAAAPERQPAIVWAGARAVRWGGRLYVHAALPQPPALRWYSLQEAAAGELGALRVRLTAESGDLRIGVRGVSSSRRLKNRYQELGIPPWLRDYYPLLYQGEQLLAIGEHWLGPGEPLFTIDIEWRAIEQT